MLVDWLSVEAEGLSAATDPEEEEAIQLFSAEKAESHWRPNGADVDWAASVAGLQLDPAAAGGHSLPPVSGSLDMTLTGGVAAIARREQSLRGRAGTVRSLELSFGPSTGLALPAPGNADLEQKIDIARIEGQVKASSVKRVSEFVDKHPEESVSIIRTWLHESA